MFKLAISDLKDCLKKNELCFELALTDVRLRYKRSKIGPLWETISLGILLSILSFLWSKLWGTKINQYLPYLISGMILWRFINLIITDGCSVFIKHDYLYRALPLPWSLAALKHVYSGIFLFLHHLPLVIISNIYFNVNFITYKLLYLIYSFPIILITSFSLTILLGFLCARYRDVISITSSLLSILIFFTPIFWTIDQMNEVNRNIFVMPNLIYHYIEIVRQPLLGNAPSEISIMLTFFSTLILIISGLFVLNKFKRKIIYWI